MEILESLYQTPKLQDAVLEVRSVYSGDIVNNGWRNNTIAGVNCPHCRTAAVKVRDDAERREWECPHCKAVRTTFKNGKDWSKSLWTQPQSPSDSGS